MEMLAHKKFVLPNPDEKFLNKHGFRYNKHISDSEGDFYSIRFPVLKYNKATTVDGEIIIDMNSGNVKINVYNYGVRAYYPPFYKTECSKVYEPIIGKINEAFRNMFRSIGIYESNV